MMASSSNEQIYVSPASISDAAPNPYVYWAEAEATGKPYGYHVYFSTGRPNANENNPVYWHQDSWYHLELDDDRLYLGAKFDYLNSLNARKRTKGKRRASTPIPDAPNPASDDTPSIHEDTNLDQT